MNAARRGIDLFEQIADEGHEVWLGAAGFDFKTLCNISANPGPGGSLQSKDEIRIVRLGLRGESSDPLGGRTQGEFALTRLACETITFAYQAGQRQRFLVYPAG